MGSQVGARNPNWKGGRTVTEHGYVLIRVGIDHHLADVRGYAYEHRLVGEHMVGRRLLPGEEVHHRDDSFAGRSNNDPLNLEVKASHADHMIEHRVRKDLQLPGQPNEMAACQCGCGASFDRFDAEGRPRRFIPGHNRQESRNLPRILAVLANGPATAGRVAESLGITRQAAKVALCKWSRAGHFARIGPGIYGVR